MNKSPDAFRTIGEVAHWLETPAHVLRFWESRFPEIAPVKRAGGRRYYRPEDMRLLGGIKHLLHDEGKTIKAVQEKLNAEGIEAISALSGDLLADKSKSEPDSKPPQDSPEQANETPLPTAVPPPSDAAASAVKPSESVATDETPTEPAKENAFEKTSPSMEAAPTAPIVVAETTVPTTTIDASHHGAPTSEDTTPSEPADSQPAIQETPIEPVGVSDGDADLDDLTASPLFTKPAASGQAAPSETAASTPASLSSPSPSAKGFFFDDSDSSDPVLEDNASGTKPAIYLNEEDSPDLTVAISSMPSISEIADDPHDDAQLNSNVLSLAAELRGLDVQDYRSAAQQELLRAAVLRLSTALGEEN